ncbi:SDR family NAD(P)-dependent oxidoreductase [Geothrix sp. 21YS21S-4]|uniref:SDR family NAD(P)-dependent oxidoreductase n=1 Tax=Geothrix sp. 21YS21S-4 TaxID=3068889 RepID=UPI0027BA009A|nr:SDR family NAD(P)-dependent oxidoreductase [Geothrix sp. 21YS21S-4]
MGAGGLVGGTVLVTGASRGLGREAARWLAERGFTVIAGTRAPALIPGTDVLALDVADEASVRAAVAHVKARHGRLDALVNNAAIQIDGTDGVLDLPLETLRRTLETNTLAPLRMAQAFAPLMGKGGRIVNVSSGGGQLSTPAAWAPAYCISKTALNAVTVQLSEGLKPKGIAVNAVCPGWVRTDMGGAEAPRSLEEGAASILWPILEAGPDVTGGFWRDGKRIEW